MYEDKADCEYDLMMTIYNTLRRAEVLKMKSLAFPSISSGMLVSSILFSSVCPILWHQNAFALKTKILLHSILSGNQTNICLYFNCDLSVLTLSHIQQIWEIAHNFCNSILFYSIMILLFIDNFNIFG